jgi:nitroimidazol reductase NimA-like FMN-containing flavoprotein (pyridoxamine 5'-phosphate oxidase superfamily)
MSMNMSRSERDAYLQELHVGVISIEQAGGAPLSAPIWYDYDPKIGLWILTEPDSKKGHALRTAERFTLVAQNEAAPLYKYVSVSGPVTEVRTATADEGKAMALRYFDEAMAKMYMESTSGGESNYYLMKPEKWLTLDYSKM